MGHMLYAMDMPDGTGSDCPDSQIRIEGFCLALALTMRTNDGECTSAI